MFSFKPPESPVVPLVSIPENADHAVSFCLPKWEHNVAYASGNAELRAAVKSGYPRFKIHFLIEELQEQLLRKYGKNGENVMLFSTLGAMMRAREFVGAREPNAYVRVLQLSAPLRSNCLENRLYAVFHPECVFPIIKQYWQHTGEGITSRQAENYLIQTAELVGLDICAGENSPKTFVEEKFGRNLTLSRANEAKKAVRMRLAEQACASYGPRVDVKDVTLYPSGMTAIFTAHRLIMNVFHSEERDLKAVCFGFSYADTLKVLEKWGPGAVFYPRGGSDDLDNLEERLVSGDLNISFLFCEVPTNPLLNTPDLRRIRQMANQFKFPVVVDDTIGNVVNINTLMYSDIKVSSLTKLFSGECNVMAGDLILNPDGQFYKQLFDGLKFVYEDALWPEDALFLERNSRDFAERNYVINETTEKLIDFLRDSPLIKEVFYPKLSKSLVNYDLLKTSKGGYSGLFSLLFYKPEKAQLFFDNLDVAKGPSLGTNFTLACPYAIIAHFNELDFVEECGVDRNIVRVSVGLERFTDLHSRFSKALKIAETS